MQRAFAFLVVLTAGCGLSFEGKYSGDLTTKLTCGTESVTNLQEVDEFKVLDTESGVEVDMDECGDLKGDVEDNVVDIDQHTCPPIVSNGVSTTITILSSSEMELNGDSLTVEFDLKADIAGPNGTAECNGKMTGTLKRPSS